jgi:hypothetical protein
MVGKRCLLARGIGDTRKEVVFLIRRAQNRWKTSNRSPWVGCTGFAKAWEMFVCERLLGSSCTAGYFPALVAEYLRASEVGMPKKILLFSRDLQDVS